MGLANIYGVAFVPVGVLLMYPLARHYASEEPSGSLVRLMVRSVFDWRSIGLPVCAAAIALSERVVSGGQRELDDYLNFLKGGCSKAPLDLLRGAGVDMEKPDALAGALRQFGRLVDELDALV